MIGIGLVVRCAGTTIVLEFSNLIIIGSVSAFLCSEIVRGYGLTIKSNLRLFQTEEKRLICMIYVCKTSTEESDKALSREVNCTSKIAK